jgi:hypothetical protein
MKLSFTYSRKHTFYFVCLAQGTPSFLSSFGLCLLLLMLWVRILISARCTTLCDKVCQWLATGRWFSSGPPVSSTNKTDRHDITEILLKVALNTIKQTNKPLMKFHLYSSKQCEYLKKKNGVALQNTNEYNI